MERSPSRRLEARSLRRPLCVWVLPFAPMLPSSSNPPRSIHPTRPPTQQTTPGNDNCGFSGGHDAIHWHEPKYLQKTTDVLVALARNLTATNATEAYAGGWVDM